MDERSGYAAASREDGEAREVHAQKLPRKVPRAPHPRLPSWLQSTLLPPSPFLSTHLTYHQRRIIDPETGSYLTALSRPNLTLTSSPVLSITPTGIHTAEKDYPADLIVFATGFRTAPHLFPLQIFGRAGLSLNEHWESLDGIPGAYNCIACHDFPNFFMLLGPNTATGHTSALIAIEK
jgi:cation diffusion facilitator CzcD-associated flavoprotein CzcO